MPSASPIATTMFRTKRFSGNTCPMTAVMPSATTIEMTAIIIGIAAPTSVPITSSSTISAAGRPNCSSPLLRSLADSSVKSRLSVSPPVMCAANPSLPFARSTLEMRSAIRFLLRLCEDDGQHGGVPVGRDQALAARSR